MGSAELDRRIVSGSVMPRMRATVGGIAIFAIGFGGGWLVRDAVTGQVPDQRSGRDCGAGKADAGSLRASGPSSADRTVALRRVVVRVPTCDRPVDGEGSNGASAWPQGAPEAITPAGIERIALDAARETGFEWDYDVDCSAYPCILWAPYPPAGENDEWNAARNEWGQHIFDALSRHAPISRSSVGGSHGIAEVFVLADPDDDADERAMERATERVRTLDGACAPTDRPAD